MNGGALLMLLLATAPACSRAAHPASSAAPAPRTHGSKSDILSVASAPATDEPSEVQASAPPQQHEAAPETPSPPAELAERYRLENEAPKGSAWVGIRNTYVINQYVFLDGELMGWVPPDTQGVFEVPPGAHNVTLSDSRDGSANAKILAEVFDDGYSYYYDVVVR